MAETRIQTVKDLASSRFDWEQALRDISRAVPAEVTLSELKGTISGEAGSGSGLRSAIAAPAIELKGCTTGQTHVATLLARLRNVDGVTRVSLAKSVRPEKSKDSASGPSPIAGTGAEVSCATKRAPEFEVVMFFEGSEVPETVEDVTVTPGTGSQPAAGGATAEPGTTPPAGSTTPPAEGGDTATPASTPQGGAAQ
jgi:hypothetical protein